MLMLETRRQQGRHNRLWFTGYIVVYCNVRMGCAVFILCGGAVLRCEFPCAALGPPVPPSRLLRIRRVSVWGGSQNAAAAQRCS